MSVCTANFYRTFLLYLIFLLSLRLTSKTDRTRCKKYRSKLHISSSFAAIFSIKVFLIRVYDSRHYKEYANSGSRQLHRGRSQIPCICRHEEHRQRIPMGNIDRQPFGMPRDRAHRRFPLPYRQRRRNRNTVPRDGHLRRIHHILHILERGIGNAAERKLLGRNIVHCSKRSRGSRADRVGIPLECMR